MPEELQRGMNVVKVHCMKILKELMAALLEP